MEEENELMEDDAFVVKESQGANIFAGAAILLVVIVSSNSIDGLIGIPVWLMVGIVGIGIIFIAKGLINKEVLRVDCNGIYYNKELITNWANFLHAYINQGNRSGSVQDNFQLTLEYRTNESAFIRTIPLTNTQDQAEEDVLAAIQRFHKLYQNEVIPIEQPWQIEEKAP